MTSLFTRIGAFEYFISQLSNETFSLSGNLLWSFQLLATLFAISIFFSYSHNFHFVMIFTVDFANFLGNYGS